MILIMIMLVWPVFSFSQEGGGIEPYVERYGIGYVDWENGYYYGIGKGGLKENEGSKARALKVAQKYAQEHILQLASRVRVDADRTVADLLEENVIIKLKGMIRAEEISTKFFEKARDPYFEVVWRAPLYGVTGLSKEVLKLKGTNPTTGEPKTPDKSVNYSSMFNDEEPTLIIDARGLKGKDRVNPALFPKIMDEDGRIIYAMDLVDEEAALTSGMARYIVTPKTWEELQSSESVVNLRVGFLGRVATILKGLFHSTNNEAYAGQPERRKRKKPYIIKSAKGTSGLMRANIIISRKDAEDLEEADEAAKILKKCRVVIIVDSSVGGIEG